MPRHWIQAILIVVALASSPLAAWSADSCPHPHVVAPGKFNNQPELWGKSDTGIITEGFVDLSRSPAEVFELEHGVDLSRNNVVAYERLKPCGGSFAFVKLDDMYDYHVAKLRSADIRTLPYAFFPIPVDLRWSASYSAATESSDKLDQLLARFSDLGSGAAETLLAQLKQRGRVELVPFGGTAARVLAVDIEQKLNDERSSSPEQRVAYGRAYARALCSWLRVMKRAEPSLVALLYTTPAVYGDYLRYATPVDNACINGLPIWLAHTTSDAGDSLYSSLRHASRASIDEASQRLCLITGGNRCVIHQYSHRAIFAALGKPDRGVPPHTDVDRWFVTRTIASEAGPQYVRRDSLSKPPSSIAAFGPSPARAAVTASR